MLKIRLARGGAKKRPYYYIVVADSHSPRDGKFIERVGTYNPMLPRDGEQKRVTLKVDRITEWLSKGGPRKMQQRAAMLGGLGGGAPGMGGMGGGPDLNRLKAMGGGKMPEPSADEMKALQDRLAGLGGGQLPGLPGLPTKK